MGEAVEFKLDSLPTSIEKIRNRPVGRIDFCVIGVQKAGTSALHHFLGQHPMIRMSHQKEVHFFDADHFFEGERPNYDAYHRAFPDRGTAAVMGECTPIYIFWPNALERLASYNPNLRLIAIFRDPIERAYSHWRMTRGRGLEDLPFSAAIREGRDRLMEPSELGVRNWTYVERGFYGHQVTKVRTLFPDDQLLFLSTDDLRNDHENTLRTIFRFLDLPPVLIEQDHIFCSPEVTRRSLISTDDIAYLEQLFRDDQRRFATLTHLDISRWA